MKPIVDILSDKCNLSYSCIRVCPVNAIEVKANRDFARIIRIDALGVEVVHMFVPKML